MRVKSGLAVCLSLACAAQLANAENYILDVGVDYSFVDADRGSSTVEDYDVWNINVIAYLDGIDHSKGPYSEAAFISNANQMRVSMGKLSDNTSPPIGADLTSFSIRMAFYDRYFYDLGYFDSDYDVRNQVQLSLGVGGYVTRYSTVEFHYQTIEVEVPSTSSKTDIDQYVIGYRNLFNLDQNMPMAFEAELTLQDEDDSSAENTLVSLEYTIYPQNDLGLFATAIFGGSDNQDFTSFGFGAEYFLMEKYIFQASYTFETLDPSGAFEDTERDIFSLGATLRL